jgi:hypothetical protein
MNGPMCKSCTKQANTESSFSLNKYNLRKTINVSWQAQGVLESWNSISSGVIDHVASNTTDQGGE